MSRTILLEDKDERRRWVALTRLASTDHEYQAGLTHVLFDGNHAYATDSVCVGRLRAPLDLPEPSSRNELNELEPDEDQIDEDDLAPFRRILPAKLLRDALGLAASSTMVRIRFDADAAHVILGDDPLPIPGISTPDVRIPYGDAGIYPSTAGILRMISDDDGEDAGELVTKIGINAERLARVSALSAAADDLITIRPRAGFGAIIVRHAYSGDLLGAVSRVRTLAEIRGE